MLSRLLRTRTINNREIKARTLSLNLTVSKIVKELSLTENITDITFRIEVDKDISFRADPELIDILLGNILQNAIRYQNVSVSDKYIKITGSRMDSSRILICIEDNGIGIPNNLRGNIFEMFFIGTEQSGGVGLGLYETKLIAKKLEGSVTLNPAKTETTEIQIILPVN
jgi:signal transduction histidine kinase